MQIDVLGAFEYNSLNNFVPVSPLTGRQTGHQKSYGGFLEAIYAFKMPDFGIPITAFSPYLGIGTGALWTHQTSPEFLSNGDENHIGGTSGSNFAYESIAGVAVPIAAVPGLAFTADYRLVGVHNAGDLNSVFYNKVANVIVKGRHRAAAGYLRPSGDGRDSLCLRRVGPAIAACTCDVACFTCSDAGAQLPCLLRLGQCSSDVASVRSGGRSRRNSTRVQTTRIDVDGYADTSLAGSEHHGTAYNLMLSMKRAIMVTRDLVREGIPETAIERHAFGDTKPLVATASDTPRALEPSHTALGSRLTTSRW